MSKLRQWFLQGGEHNERMDALMHEEYIACLGCGAIYEEDAAEMENYICVICGSLLRRMTKEEYEAEAKSEVIMSKKEYWRIVRDKALQDKRRRFESDRKETD